MLRGVCVLCLVLVPLSLASCSTDPTAPVAGLTARDPDTAPAAAIDRFSGTAGHLFVRTATNGLPGPDQPINFDRAPFITQGLGSTGQVLRYYNFDVMPEAPVPIFVFFRAGESMPMAGQLNVIDAIPGDPGYNDFWQVVRVTVPLTYVANTVTSLAEIVAGGFVTQAMPVIVNCPVVPRGSTAALGGGVGGLMRGWFRNQVVHYFEFNERALSPTSAGLVPQSPLFVTFNINPPQSGGGPPSGFRTETGTLQTHNVAATVPSDAAYSPLWGVNVYDNTAFASVSNLSSAQMASSLGTGVALVNCPVVGIP